MLRLLIIAQESTEQTLLYDSLLKSGFDCSLIPNDNEIIAHNLHQHQDLVLVEMGSCYSNARIWQLIQSIKQRRNLLSMALVPKGMLDNIDGCHGLDDFLTSPYDTKELILRINRLFNGTRRADSKDLIKCDGLVIDLAKYEVTLDGRRLDLTFREYELLKFLAGNRGRVYTRETLLNRVWGYDYYGGDRTVDVHIRRLRSKIEDSKHSFIDTVRNIGYKFSDNNV